MLHICPSVEQPGLCQSVHFICPTQFLSQWCQICCLSSSCFWQISSKKWFRAPVSCADFDQNAPLQLCRDLGLCCVSLIFFLSNCLFCAVCVFVCVCLCVCVSWSSFRATGKGRTVRLCVTSPHIYSQKWIRYFPPTPLFSSPTQCCWWSVSRKLNPLHLLSLLRYLNRKFWAGSLTCTHL